MSDGHSSPLLLVRPFSRPLVLLPAYSVCIGRYSCTLLSRPSTSSFSHEGGAGDFFPLTDGRAFKDGQTGMKAYRRKRKTDGRSLIHGQPRFTTDGKRRILWRVKKGSGEEKTRTALILIQGEEGLRFRELLCRCGGGCVIWRWG